MGEEEHGRSVHEQVHNMAAEDVSPEITERKILKIAVRI
jgi:hypothetical protein